MSLKPAVIFVTSLMCITLNAHAGGRQPCDRGAGGISHCKNGKFICNNGAVSRSKKVCAGHSSEVAAGGVTASTKKKGKQK